MSGGAQRCSNSSNSSTHFNTSHHLREAHQLVDAWEVGSHALYRFCRKSTLGAKLALEIRLRTGVDLHREQIVVASDGGGCAGELLAEGVGNVMRRVGGDDEHAEKNEVRVASQELAANCAHLRRVRLRIEANAQDVVVLPTPPFPPTKIHFKVAWSMTLRSVASFTSAM